VTYWAINAVFLGLVAVTAGAALLLRWARTRSTGVSSTRGLVGYDESRISGAFVGIAPLEDFAYAVAALVLLPSVWTLLGSRRETEAAKAARAARRRGTADAEEAR